MDSDFGKMLESVLSDPQQMEKITQAAQSLMGGGSETSPPPVTPPEVSSPAFAPIDTKILKVLSSAFSQRGEASRSTRLLVAMRPYMRPEKQEKLDRAMKIAQLAHIAGTVMREYGDGSHGI